MRRLGMLRRPDLDFDHPDIAEGAQHRRHIVYRTSSSDLWRRARQDQQF
jgi:hypothetical protein